MTSSLPPASPQTNSTPAVDTLQIFETAAERRQYAHPFLDILASNSNRRLFPDEYSDYPPHRYLYIMTDSEFGAIYNNDIHPKLLSILNGYPAFEELHAVIMASNSDQPCGNAKLYEAVLVIFSKDSVITPQQAKDLVIEIDTCINLMWAGKRIYTDVCQSIFNPDDDTQSDNRPGGRVQRKIDDLQNGETPLPGSSIGIENCDSTGTFSLYFKHKTDIYGVANCHVLDKKSLEPYRSTQTEFRDPSEELTSE
ncbi:hypothetical protein DL98DRAFT_160997 [Cadophora sp. DSE1049]|nr:hypothetical protein DL98DRAFT_160997 [Cadophora sp. DSE1049]